MLQAMRRFTKSWISSLFLGALTLSFVVWGVADVFRGSSNTTTMVTVGSISIEQNDFRRDYQNFLRIQGAQLGRTISPQEAQQQKLGDKLMQQEIGRIAIDNEVNRLGLTASDQIITQRIQAVPQFAGLTGTFDHATFLQVIGRMNYTEQGFIETERQDLAREQLIFALEGGYGLPPGYGRALFAFYTELRAADYFTIDAKSLPPLATPSDAALEAYVKRHAARYSTPEYRDVTYAEMTPQDVMGSLSVTEAQIKTAYDQNKDTFVVPEKRHIEQIVFKSEDEAKAAAAKLASGMSFDALAASRGLKTSDVDLGDLTKADLNDARSAAFSVPAGGNTAPLKTDFGWVLMHVVAITPGKTTTYEQAHDQIKQQLLQEMAQSKLSDVSNAYTDANSSGLSLVKAAEKVGMHVVHAPAVDANGLAPDGSKADVPSDPDFRAIVANADVGEEGDPVVTKDGNLFVVLVNGVIPPKLKPLDAVRADALAGWMVEQRADELKQKAAELAAEANRDKSLTAAAKSVGAAVEASPAISRNTADDTFSPELVLALYKALPGETVYGPLGKGDGYVVARVTGISHPSPDPRDMNFGAAMHELSEGVGNDFADLLSASVEKKHGVKYTGSYGKLLSDVVGGGS